MPKLLAPCGQLCPEVCWWLPFPIVGIPVHLWYLGYINTFLFIHSIVCSNHQNVSIKFLTQATMQPGRQFNASLMMGQDMMEQLAMMDFKHPTQVFPYVRCAIWATMLTSPKSQDGYAKILTKQDLDKLRGPAHQAKVLQAEDQLAKSWEVAMGHHVPQSTGVKAFGKMAVRTILFLTAKQRMSREATTYEDLTAILVQFTKDVQGTTTTSLVAAQPDIQVTNVIDASPQAIAFLQAEHMKIHGMHLC